MSVEKTTSSGPADEEATSNAVDGEASQPAGPGDIAQRTEDERVEFLQRMMPADTPSYMAPAWLGCISYAIGQSEIIRAFRAETGNNWIPGKTGLDRMIDEATGAERLFIEAFIRWANVHIWGPIDG